MNHEMKITNRFLKEIRKNLYRPHSFAYERVGFVYCKATKEGSLIASTYEAIADELYKKDKMVGAKFSGDAIFAAMKRSLKTKEGVFHIHIHEHKGEPHLSGIDIKSVLEISNSMADVNPNVKHGCILLSEDWCKTYVLTNDKKRLEAIKTNVIKFPFSILYTKGELL
jgi:hypothetical protein